jgi:hypothetical protein
MPDSVQALFSQGGIAKARRDPFRHASYLAQTCSEYANIARAGKKAGVYLQRFARPPRRGNDVNGVMRVAKRD